MTLLLKNYEELKNNMNSEARKSKNLNLSTVEDYMPYLYYKWFNPGQIANAIATPDKNIYIRNAQDFIAQNTAPVPPHSQNLMAQNRTSTPPRERPPAT